MGMWARRRPTKWFLYHISLIEWLAHGLANLNAILHDPPVICLLSNLKNKKEPFTDSYAGAYRVVCGL